VRWAARKEQGIRFPVAVYPSTAAYDSTAGGYAASGFPELVLVDKHGIIRRVTAGWGAISVAPLDSAIQALIRAR
jgi:hypothetical protein